jgi:hypothetical protein
MSKEGIVEVKLHGRPGKGRYYAVPPANQGQADPHPPFKMKQEAFNLLKWNVMFFGRMHDMSRFAHQLELGFYSNPVKM